MIEGRHRPPLDKVDVGSLRDPIGEALPREIEAPAEPAGNRSQRFFDLAPQARLGTNAIGEDNLSTWLDHASEFVERRFWVRTGRYHIGCDDDVKRIIRKQEMFRIHYLKFDDIEERELQNSSLRFL